MARKWIKMWVQESLTGTLRFDFTPAERGVFYDLMLLAGNCRLDGVIAAGVGVPYPHAWIANTLNIQVKLLDDTLRKCTDTGRMEENGDGIHILNWDKYQSEYERQKPYRNKDQHVSPAGVVPLRLAAPSTEAQDVWTKALSELRMQMTSANYDTWLKDTEGCEVRPDCLVVLVASHSAVDWLQNSLSKRAAAAVSAVLGRELNILFMVRPSP